MSQTLVLRQMMSTHSENIIKQSSIGDSCSLEYIKTEKSAKLETVLENLSNDEIIMSKPEFANLVNFSDYKDHPIHRWFKYREGYSTSLIKTLLARKKNQTRVLDPFCGSGTTLIASNELGIDSVGFDINPLATFVSEVKTREYTKENVENLKTLVEEVLDISGVQSTPVPKLKIIDKVFNEEILETLLKIKYNLSIITSRKYHNFLKLGWLAILENVSNARKEGNGIKYKFTKRTKDGYVKTPQNKWEDEAFGENKSSFVVKTLKEQYIQMLNDLETNPFKKTDTKVYTESSIHLTDYLEEGTVSTAIFSPPYANCFDYFEIFKVELWMGDFVNDYKELRDLRGSALRSNPNTRLDVVGREINLKELDQLLELMDEDVLWDKKIKKFVKGYFEDMHSVMTEIFDLLEPDGECIIVVGTSAYSGVIVPTDLLLSKIGKKIGFSDIKIFPTRHLTTSSQQRGELEPFLEYLRESVIVLKKSKQEVPLKVNELPTDTKIRKYQRYNITSNNVAYLTHNIHKYPAKFIPQIPRWGISKYQQKNKKNIILDPFCGSGTTLVEGMLVGHEIYGIDIDPLSRLISKVKTTKIDENVLISLNKEIISKIEIKKKGVFRPSIPTLSHWFNEDAVEKLSIIRDVIEEYRGQKDIYDFLIVCFSSIIRRVSNADNESQKTYVSHTNIKIPEDAFRLFSRNIKLYSDRLIELSKLTPKSGKAKIFDDCIDSRNFSEYWKRNIGTEVDIAITSPPYIKAIDYIYNQMVEHFWIGDLFGLENQKLQNEHKRKYVGTKQILADEYSKKIHTGYCKIDSIVDEVYKIDKKHAAIVSKFFLDMEANIKNVHEVLKKGGHYIIVIGNNNVSGIEINSNEIIAEIGENNGFKLNNIFAYEIRNRFMRFPRNGKGGLIKEDWIVDLEKL